MVRKREKVHLIFIFLISSNSNSHKTTGFSSSEKITEFIWSKFFLILIWCMYDQSSLRPIDGKYPGVTVLLVAVPANHWQRIAPLAEWQMRSCPLWPGCRLFRTQENPLSSFTTCILASCASTLEHNIWKLI